MSRRIAEKLESVFRVKRGSYTNAIFRRGRPALSPGARRALREIRRAQGAAPGHCRCWGFLSTRPVLLALPVVRLGPDNALQCGEVGGGQDSVGDALQFDQPDSPFEAPRKANTVIAKTELQRRFKPLQ